VNLESKNFLVRTLTSEDKEPLRELENTRPWAKGMLKMIEELKEITDATDEDTDFFEKLWNDYIKSEYFWVIERKPGTFCGDIQLDIDSEHEAHFYIQLLDDADISSFGSELFDAVIDCISHESAIQNFYIELWNEEDRSKQIYEEAGYVLEGGCLEIDCR
jgi:RimJ/RimL family protein N-acetyltransferase